jgi:hypothetical protein
MPATRLARTISHRARILAALLAAMLVACAAAVVTAPAAHAASQGTGFGAWAPISTYGWHGSMLIDGVHTYCILPGAPAPTGQSMDQGLSGTAAGLSAHQLSGINLLVTKYGQTNDPVQAAAVGWAVKAITNLNETLHHFGYRGDSLAEAIHWTFSALAPEHSAEIQRLAVLYYDEARAAPAGVAGGSGTMMFTTDAADPRRGSVRVDASTADATGTLSLVGATFVATGTSTLTDAVPGVEYPIVTTPPSAGRPYAVEGTGHLRLTAVAAVRHFTTTGGQDTAGPAGEVGFDVAGSDAAPRVPLFSPTISTQVQSAYASGGPFVDDVVFGGSIEDWPRAPDGAYLPVTATAEVYRTDDLPTLDDAGAPSGAEHIGSLGLTTDPASGPTGPYRVMSAWELTGPGFYTAVWSIRAQAQPADVASALPPGYVWTEPFGEPTQITLWAEVSSLAEATVTTGDTLSDKIVVSGPLPTDGLTVSSSVYRAADGITPSDACTDEAIVWTSSPHTMLATGEHVVTAPAVTEPGTYYWQERAVDAAGTLVHLGACGVAHETTLVVARTSQSMPDAAASVLAATGAVGASTRAVTGGAIALLTAGGALVALARRRRSTSLATDD